MLISRLDIKSNIWRTFRLAPLSFFSTPLTKTVSFTTVASQQEEENKKNMKYVLVTGGVVSGLGKGVTASSVGVVLKACGLRVTSIKIGTFFRFLLLCVFLWTNYIFDFIPFLEICFVFLYDVLFCLEA